MSKREELKKLGEFIQETKKQMREVAESFFQEAVKELFEQYPKLECFSWKQYTPYFNDGDTCEFSANTDDFNIIYDGEEHEEVYYSRKYKSMNSEGELGKIAGFLSNEVFAYIDEDDLKDMFGDHAQITVYKDRIEVDEYDHD